VNDEKKGQATLVSQWPQPRHGRNAFRWRVLAYTKLREPFDGLADEFTVPLTHDGHASTPLTASLVAGATMFLSRSERC
jgi:hypothetical protein